jgi:hypothetical protein
LSVHTPRVWRCLLIHLWSERGRPTLAGSKGRSNVASFWRGFALTIGPTPAFHRTRLGVTLDRPMPLGPCGHPRYPTPGAPGGRGDPRARLQTCRRQRNNQLAAFASNRDFKGQSARRSVTRDRALRPLIVAQGTGTHSKSFGCSWVNLYQVRGGQAMQSAGAGHTRQKKG